MKTRYFKEVEGKGMSPSLLQKLDYARTIAGIPFVITSHIRKDNPESSHYRGLAVDSQAVHSRVRYVILKSLVTAGFTRIGVYPKHIHADVDNSKDLRVIWYGRYKKK